MNHFTSPEFWKFFGDLPAEVQELARANYEILEANPRHPSLHFEKVGNYWSVRIGRGHRALAAEIEGGFLWGWIGSHAEYDRIIS